jgi:hypothetical protein
VCEVSEKKGLKETKFTTFGRMHTASKNQEISQNLLNSGKKYLTVKIKKEDSMKKVHNHFS